MSSKDLIDSIAVEMKKKPEDFQKFVDILEENFLDTVESLQDVTDEQWKDMGIPVGLINKIKKKIAQPAQAPEAQQPATKPA